MKKEEYSTQSQRMMILAHLKKKPITTYQAIDDYGFTRLSAIIFDLREMGFDIQDRWCYGINRYGHNVKWKEYYLNTKGK